MTRRPYRVSPFGLKIERLTATSRTTIAAIAIGDELRAEPRRRQRAAGGGVGRQADRHHVQEQERGRQDRHDEFDHDPVVAEQTPRRAERLDHPRREGREAERDDDVPGHGIHRHVR